MKVSAHRTRAGRDLVPLGGDLPPGLWLRSPAGWLLGTSGVSYGTPTLVWRQMGLRLPFYMSLTDSVDDIKLFYRL